MERTVAGLLTALLSLAAVSCGDEEMVLAYRTSTAVSAETLAEPLLDAGVVSPVQIPADFAPSDRVVEWYPETIGLVITEPLEPGTIVSSDHIGVGRLIPSPRDLPINDAPSRPDFDIVHATVDWVDVGVLCADGLRPDFAESMANLAELSEVDNDDPAMRTFRTVEIENGTVAYGYGVRGSSLCVTGLYLFEKDFVETVSKVLRQR